MADFEYYIKGDMALRCNSEGLWYLSMGDQVFFLQEEESFWRVLVLLEKPYEEVREKLRGGFCYLNVVLAGLDSECSGLLIPDTDLGENPRRERGV
ncbi:hypothetical protein [Pseudomonas aeruginosa]|uniref:hypothetical protein n=1 Tax=Pseudomonas aeruginosa TaxID=287 RepID=UPI002955944F|nr:hypothetical protein [Pseudomonas aeruginosa]MDV7848645.1 hypothetical protein [Pseudomonas aeruginosa]